MWFAKRLASVAFKRMWPSLIALSVTAPIVSAASTMPFTSRSSTPRNDALQKQKNTQTIGRSTKQPSNVLVEASKRENEISTRQLYYSWVNGTLDIEYSAGMQTNRESEAIAGSLPKGQNGPQKCPFGLYAEQLNGTAFTVPRKHNLRTWLYKILPSVSRSRFEPLSSPYIVNDFSSSNPNVSSAYCPDVQRWNPQKLETKSGEKLKFYQGLRTLCGAGDVSAKQGMSIYLYAFNDSMLNESMCNADGDLLIVPQQKTLLIRTEFGCMEVPPKQIAVIQRGIHFSVMVNPDEAGPDNGEDGQFARGYICELYESHFEIPDLGPIGANGLANERDFETVTASYECSDKEYKLIHKYGGKLYQAKTSNASVYDVVAWHGNYVPYRYDLTKFCAVFSVSFDHLDPSLFTVLTAQTLNPGVAVCDFVIFPYRWTVFQNSFRPPCYHRNCMSEFVANIHGNLDDTEFVGGMSQMHPVMTPHGVPSDVYNKAVHGTSPEENNKPKPPTYKDLEFMFESTYLWKFTAWSQQADDGQSNEGLLKRDFLDARYSTFNRDFDDVQAQQKKYL